MNYIVKSFYPPLSTGDVDTLIFKDDFKYLIIPVVDGTNVIAVYDISNVHISPYTMNLVQSVSHITTNYIVDFDLN